MKLYRLHKIHGAGISAGFEFFTNYRDACRAYREWMSGDEDWVCGCDGSKVELISVQPTRAGILRALRGMASHPDNG